MSKLVGAFILGWALLLSGCTAFSNAVTDPVQLYLLPPAQGPKPALLKQKVVMTVKGQEHQFITVSRLNHKDARLIALLPTGQQLLYLGYDGVQFQQRSAPSIELPGKAILATIQFTLWPEQALRAYYPQNQGWHTEIKSERRQLWHNGVLYLDIHYEAERIRVENHLDAYQATIQTLEKRDLSR